MRFNSIALIIFVLYYCSFLSEAIITWRYENRLTYQRCATLQVNNIGFNITYRTKDGNMKKWTYSLPLTKSWTEYDNEIGYCGDISQNCMIKWIDDSTMNSIKLTFKRNDNNYALDKIMVNLPKAIKFSYLDEEDLKLTHHGSDILYPIGKSFLCKIAIFELINDHRNVTGTVAFHNLQFEVFNPNQTNKFSEHIECLGNNVDEQKQTLNNSNDSQNERNSQQTNESDQTNNNSTNLDVTSLFILIIVNVLFQL